MTPDVHVACTAFEGFRRIASGPLLEIVGPAKEVVDQGEHEPVLIFDDETGQQVEVDFRGTLEELKARIVGPTPEAISRGRGRPKLGVVPREVTLLPRHWDWLNTQPGGASVALRKLVEEARRQNEGKDRVRKAQEAGYRFLSAMAGNLPGFEEATRAYFASDWAGFQRQTLAWPRDVRDHARKMSIAAFDDPTAEVEVLT